MNSRQRTSVALVMAGVTLSGLAVCTAAGAQEQEAARGKVVVGNWGFDLSGMDRSVDPGDDFYRYAGGTWMKDTRIPADAAFWNSMSIVGEKAEGDIRRLIEAVAAGKQVAGSVEQKVADYYNAYLDTGRINELGLQPFKADLERIASLETHETVGGLIGNPELSPNSPIVSVPSLDLKDPDHYTVVVAQAGLGLPNRDYYLSTDETFAGMRAKYASYIERLLALAGYPDARASAQAVAALETRMAELHWPLEKVRDRDLIYNPKSRAELEAFAPGFPWDAVLDAGGLGGQERFVVREAGAVAGLAGLFRSTPVPTWRAYLTFHYLNGKAEIMPRDFDEAHFEFFGRVVSGQPEQRARWKRAVANLNGRQGGAPLAQAVGQLYVRRHFSPEAKAQTEALVDNLLAAYRKRIEASEWMSPETREVAVRKTRTARIKIGYPERWTDYSALNIEPGDAYGNSRRLSRFEWSRLVSRLGKPTDKDEWSMAPQTVNAYYNPVFNEIVFPAAILQPPLFDPNADPAVNYGGIGSVIGHEMGHGYDDQGAKSDEYGVLRPWWKPEDEERFRVRTRALAAQFSSYSPLPGLHVNGEFTSGENIGDLGGLSVALEAYLLSLGGQPAPVLDGFTGPQRFFLGWAQVWRGVQREEALRWQLTSDFHSPGEYRVNGIVRNIDAWYRAFDVKPKDALYLEPEARVRIW